MKASRELASLMLEKSQLQLMDLLGRLEGIDPRDGEYDRTLGTIERVEAEIKNCKAYLGRT
jgi:hypothetical protein